MRCAIILVSDDPSACEIFDREKEGLIPRSLRELDRIRAIGFDFVTSVYKPSAAKFSLAEHVLHTARSAKGVAILCDSRLQWLTTGITSACFVTTVEFKPDASSYKNVLQATVTRLVKNLAHVCSHMRDAGSRNALQLPFRNFLAKELKALQELFVGSTLAPEFISTLDQAISELNRRRMPKRRDDYPDKYYVDDKESFFSYGKEHHSELETGAAHVPLCRLNGNFRFGHRIATNEHYNVSKDKGKNGKISGFFSDCHDQLVEIREKSHVNVFSNDYWTAPS